MTNDRAPGSRATANKPESIPFGLALGGGGARGLAHILMLEVLDEFGVRPQQIAGTSIGAILGALYASGHSAGEIRELVDELVRAENKELKHSLVKLNVFKWIEFVDPSLGKGGLVDADHFMGLLHKAVKQDRFEQLAVPLRVVATDYWTGEMVVLESGDLISAVRASMALPGIFSPVEHGDRLLVDGGVVNPLPYDILGGEISNIIAIDVTGTMLARTHVVPPFFDSIFRTFRIMGHAIVEEKLKHNRPEIYIRPTLTNIRTLDFNKHEEIYRQAAPAKEELKIKLAAMLT